MTGPVIALRNHINNPREQAQDRTQHHRESHQGQHHHPHQSPTWHPAPEVQGCVSPAMNAPRIQQQALQQAPATVPAEQKVPALDALKALAKPQVVPLDHNVEVRALTDRGLVKSAFMATIPLSEAEAQGTYNFSYRGKDSARGAFSADGKHPLFTRSVANDPSFQWENDIAVRKEIVDGKVSLHVVMYGPMESVTIKVGGKTVTLNRAEIKEKLEGVGPESAPSLPRTPSSSDPSGVSPAKTQLPTEPSRENPFPGSRQNPGKSEPPSRLDRTNDDRLYASSDNRVSRPARFVAFQDGPKSAEVVVDPRIVKKLQACLTVSGSRNAHPTKAFADFPGAVKVFQELKSDPERAALLKQYNEAASKSGGKPLQEVVAFYKGMQGHLLMQSSVRAIRNLWRRCEHLAGHLMKKWR